MKDSNIKVIRSAVGSLSSIGLIKELRKRGIKVIGIDCNPLAVGFHFCDKSYVVKRGNHPEFLNDIFRICDIEKPKAIISGPEEEILTLSKNKNLFTKRNILLLLPDYKTAKICADKLATHRFFIKENIPTPRFYYQKNNFKFPITIKPRFGRGSTNVFKAKNKEELEFYSKFVEKPIFQEFIEGDEYTIDVFADFDGNPLSIVPRRRFQVESGISIKGETVYDKEIINWCEKIVKKLKLIGPSCIQGIKDKKGINFIEINTRFGGGSILSMKADPSIISNLIKMIKGEKLSKSKGFKEGLVMLRYYSEVYYQNL
jgi:carbamoyl-phosphate synthase large subunit